MWSPLVVPGSLGLTEGSGAMKQGFWVSSIPTFNVTFSKIQKLSSKIRELNSPLNKYEWLPEQKLVFTIMDEGGITSQ